jgi:hypothetical protein
MTSCGCLRSARRCAILRRRRHSSPQTSTLAVLVIGSPQTVQGRVVNSVDASDGTTDRLRTFHDYSGSPTQRTNPGTTPAWVRQPASLARSEDTRRGRLCDALLLSPRQPMMFFRGEALDRSRQAFGSRL